MRIASVNDARLMLAMHQGVFEKPRWNGLLVNLRAEAAADSAALSVRLGGGRCAEYTDGEAMPGAVSAVTWSQCSYPGDGAAMRPGRVYAEHEFDDFSQHRGREIFFRSVRVRTPGNSEAWLTLCGGQDFTAAFTSLMSRLAEHLRVALFSLERIEQAEGRAEIFGDAAAHARLDWLALNEEGKIIHALPGLEKRYSRPAIFRRKAGGGLALARTQAESRLRDIVRDLPPRPDSRALVLSHDPFTTMMVVRADHGESGAGKPVFAFAYVGRHQAYQSNLGPLLVDLFGLLPSEGRFAASLAQGMAIADAARLHQLTIETARNYSKKIYLKTGVHGQVGLVNRVRSLLGPALSGQD